MFAIHRLKRHISFAQLSFCITWSTVKPLWVVVLCNRSLQTPVVGAGAKAFGSGLPACALVAPGQISTHLLAQLSQAANLEVGPLYAVVAPFRRRSQDPGHAGVASWGWERSGQGWGWAMGPHVLTHSSGEKLDEDMDPTRS